MNSKRLLKKLFIFMLISIMSIGATATVYGAPKEPTLKYIGKFKLTAYCPCHSCSGGWGDGTASGKRAKENRTIAVDPKVIKLGTRIKINDVTYTAEDVGGGVKGKHIDVFFSSHSKALKFGLKKNQKVYQVIK